MAEDTTKKKRSTKSKVGEAADTTQDTSSEATESSSEKEPSEVDTKVDSQEETQSEADSSVSDDGESEVKEGEVNTEASDAENEEDQSECQGVGHCCGCCLTQEITAARVGYEIHVIKPSNTDFYNAMFNAGRIMGEIHVNNITTNNDQVDEIILAVKNV